MKRKGYLFNSLISDSNIERAIINVNKSHKYIKNHKLNPTTAWVNNTLPERIEELRQIVINGFTPSPTRDFVIYDVNARKERLISEPKQYPDQYIHHMIIQVLEPVILRRTDYWCCGSIKGRGSIQVQRGIKKWMKSGKGVKYCAELDIHHFYDSLSKDVVMERLSCIVKDKEILTLAKSIISNGISIGSYPSQWFANMVLQPIDAEIRKFGVAHYVRYMDNLTLFSDNKRKLRKLVMYISKLLEEKGLRLKSDWQIFCTSDRMPRAVGYRYGRDFCLIRKGILIKIRRLVARYDKLRKNGRYISPKLARSLLSRTGQLKHCNSFDIRRRLIPKGTLKIWRTIARQ